MTNERNIPTNQPKNAEPVTKGYDKLPEHLPEFEPVRADEKQQTQKTAPTPAGGDPSEGDVGTRH